jgi:hypothetical protein
MSLLLWIDSSNEMQQAHRIRWCHNNMQAAGEGMIPYLQADWCWPWSWCELDADYDADVSLMLIMILMWAWCWSWSWCELDAAHDDVSLMLITMMWAWCCSWWCEHDADHDNSLALTSNLGQIEKFFSISALTPHVKPLGQISTFAPIGMLDLSRTSGLDS